MSWRDTLSPLLALCEGKPPVTVGFPYKVLSCMSIGISFAVKLLNHLLRTTHDFEFIGYIYICWWNVVESTDENFVQSINCDARLNLLITRLAITQYYIIVTIRNTCYRSDYELDIKNTRNLVHTGELWNTFYECLGEKYSRCREVRLMYERCQLRNWWQCNNEYSSPQNMYWDDAFINAIHHGNVLSKWV